MKNIFQFMERAEQVSFVGQGLTKHHYPVPVLRLYRKKPVYIAIIPKH